MLQFRQVSIRALRERFTSLHAVHGLEQARAALDLARTNVWSPRESRLRYCYEVEAGLPPALLNVRVFDDDGILIGHPDLFDPEAALATEFDGAQHRDREQHRRDNIRDERFESVGVTVVRSDGLDLRPRHRRQLIHRMQDGHRRGLNRNRTHDRWVLDPRVWPETT